MIPEDTKGKRTGPNEELKFKTDMDTGAILCQFLFTGDCVKQCVTSLKSLGEV